MLIVGITSPASICDVLIGGVTIGLAGEDSSSAKLGYKANENSNKNDPYIG